MRTDANPFTDPAEVRGPLYATADRLASRTSALHGARVSGRHAADVIADLAADAASPASAVIADIGCGRGTTTLTLASRFPRARIAAIDLSAALLTAARNRTAAPVRAAAIRADFHRLPLADRACDLIVAAFCLYHSPDPASVIAEIARCLTRHGTAVIAVKSADSYRELDRLMPPPGSTPQPRPGRACTRPPGTSTARGSPSPRPAASSPAPTGQRPSTSTPTLATSSSPPTASRSSPPPSPKH
jgi:SAM-dependent methyltransferase